MNDNLIVNFHFKVDWGGTRIGFTEVYGLDFETEIIEYREGNDPSYLPLKIPGKQKFKNVVLKRGIFASDNEFYEWYNTINLTKVERRDLTISLLDEQHEPKVVWKVRSAWPIKIKSPKFKSLQSEIAVETIEIAHEGIIIQHA